jgi:predicted DNA-binding antitoxin AbrB/MazE fold protein
MTQVTEAIYTHGILKPAVDLSLREQQRVRVIVEPIADSLEDRDAAVARLKAGIAGMQFFSNGPLPTRGISMIALDTNVLLYACDRLTQSPSPAIDVAERVR